MPGEIAKRECEALTQSLRDLQNERLRLYRELMYVQALVAAALVEFTSATGDYRAANIEFLTVGHLREVARQQLERCHARSDSSCAEETATLRELEQRMQDAIAEMSEAQARLDSARERVHTVSDQYEAVHEAMDVTDAESKAREQRMWNGHCHRFKS